MAFEAEPYIRRANYYETDKMGIVHHPTTSAGLRRRASTLCVRRGFGTRIWRTKAF